MVYIISGTLSVLLLLLATRIKRTERWGIYCLATIPPIITATFRYLNGADYMMYMRIFQIYNQAQSSINSFHSVKSIEFGFYILIRICSVFFGNKYYLYFGLIATIICGFYYAGLCRQSRIVVLSGLLFFITGTYFDSFNGLRQYLAAAISFFAIQYITEGRFLKYIILILFASTFHYTALLMIPVYWIRDLKIDLIKAIGVAAALLLLGSLLFNLVKIVLSYTRYEYYLTSPEFEITPTLNTILTTTLISLLFFGNCWLKQIQLSKTTQILLNFQLLAWCSALLSLSIPLASRLQYYFVPLQILTIPAFLKTIRKQKTRILIGSVIVASFTLMTAYGIFMLGWFDAWPYHFYFDYV